MSRRIPDISPELILKAYSNGLFPMAETRLGDKIYWLDPEMRGILPLDGFHLPRRLRRTVLSNVFHVTVDTAFSKVVSSCAESRPGREDTWINPQIERIFATLHQMGYAHSVECWQQDRLVGGLYGVAIGGAFFGESMFSQQTDASKVALVHLMMRLRIGGYHLLDTQFVTSHLAQFGALEIPREQYKHVLRDAIRINAVWHTDLQDDTVQAEIQRLGLNPQQGADS